MNTFIKEHIGKLISLCIVTLSAALIAIAEKILPLEKLRNVDALVYVKLIIVIYHYYNIGDLHNNSKETLW